MPTGRVAEPAVARAPLRERLHDRLPSALQFDFMAAKPTQGEPGFGVPSNKKIAALANPAGVMAADHLESNPVYRRRRGLAGYVLPKKKVESEPLMSPSREKSSGPMMEKPTLTQLTKAVGAGFGAAAESPLLPQAEKSMTGEALYAFRKFKVQNGLNVTVTGQALTQFHRGLCSPETRLYSTVRRENAHARPLPDAVQAHFDRTPEEVNRDRVKAFEALAKEQGAADYDVAGAVANAVAKVSRSLALGSTPELQDRIDDAVNSEFQTLQVEKKSLQLSQARMRVAENVIRMHYLDHQIDAVIDAVGPSLPGFRTTAEQINAAITEAVVDVDMTRLIRAWEGKNEALDSAVASKNQDRVIDALRSSFPALATAYENKDLAGIGHALNELNADPDLAAALIAGDGVYIAEALQGKDPARIAEYNQARLLAVHKSITDLGKQATDIASKELKDRNEAVEKQFVQLFQDVEQSVKRSFDPRVTSPEPDEKPKKSRRKALKGVFKKEAPVAADPAARQPFEDDPNYQKARALAISQAVLAIDLPHAIDAALWVSDRPGDARTAIQLQVTEAMQNKFGRGVNSSVSGDAAINAELIEQTLKAIQDHCDKKGLKAAKLAMQSGPALLAAEAGVSPRALQLAANGADKIAENQLNRLRKAESFKELLTEENFPGSSDAERLVLEAHVTAIATQRKLTATETYSLVDALSQAITDPGSALAATATERHSQLAPGAAPASTATLGLLALQELNDINMSKEIGALGKDEAGTAEIGAKAAGWRLAYHLDQVPGEGGDLLKKICGHDFDWDNKGWVLRSYLRAADAIAKTVAFGAKPFLDPATIYASRDLQTAVSAAQRRNPAGWPGRDGKALKMPYGQILTNEQKAVLAIHDRLNPPAAGQTRKKNGFDFAIHLMRGGMIDAGPGTELFKADRYANKLFGKYTDNAISGRSDPNANMAKKMYREYIAPPGRSPWFAWDKNIAHSHNRPVGKLRKMVGLDAEGTGLSVPLANGMQDGRAMMNMLKEMEKALSWRIREALPFSDRPYDISLLLDNDGRLSREEALQRQQLRRDITRLAILQASYANMATLQNFADSEGCKDSEALAKLKLLVGDPSSPGGLNTHGQNILKQWVEEHNRHPDSPPSGEGAFNVGMTPERLRNWADSLYSPLQPAEGATPAADPGGLSKHASAAHAEDRRREAAARSELYAYSDMASKRFQKYLKQMRPGDGEAGVHAARAAAEADCLEALSEVGSAMSRVANSTGTSAAAAVVAAMRAAAQTEGNDRDAVRRAGLNAGARYLHDHVRPKYLAGGRLESGRYFEGNEEFDKTLRRLERGHRAEYSAERGEKNRDMLQLQGEQVAEEAVTRATRAAVDHAMQALAKEQHPGLSFDEALKKGEQAAVLAAEKAGSVTTDRVRATVLRACDAIEYQLKDGANAESIDRACNSVLDVQSVKQIEDSSAQRFQYEMRLEPWRASEPDISALEDIQRRKDALAKTAPQHIAETMDWDQAAYDRQMAALDGEWNRLDGDALLARHKQWQKEKPKQELPAVLTELKSRPNWVRFETYEHRVTNGQLPEGPGRTRRPIKHEGAQSAMTMDPFQGNTREGVAEMIADVLRKHELNSGLNMVSGSNIHVSSRNLSESVSKISSKLAMMIATGVPASFAVRLDLGSGRRKMVTFETNVIMGALTLEMGTAEAKLVQGGGGGTGSFGEGIKGSVGYDHQHTYEITKRDGVQFAFRRPGRINNDDKVADMAADFVHLMFGVADTRPGKGGGNYQQEGVDRPCNEEDQTSLVKAAYQAFGEEISVGCFKVRQKEHNMNDTVSAGPSYTSTPIRTQILSEGVTRTSQTSTSQYTQSSGWLRFQKDTTVNRTRATIAGTLASLHGQIANGLGGNLPASFGDSASLTQFLLGGLYAASAEFYNEGHSSTANRFEMDGKQSPISWAIDSYHNPGSFISAMAQNLDKMAQERADLKLYAGRGTATFKEPTAEAIAERVAKEKQKLCQMLVEFLDQCIRGERNGTGQTLREWTSQNAAINQLKAGEFLAARRAEIAEMRQKQYAHAAKISKASLDKAAARKHKNKHHIMEKQKLLMKANAKQMGKQLDRIHSDPRHREMRSLRMQLRHFVANEAGWNGGLGVTAQMVDRAEQLGLIMR